MATLSESQDLTRPEPPVLKKTPSFEDIKVHRRKESASRQASPKMIRRGKPSDIPPIQQELADRVKSEPFVKKFGLPSTETLIKDYSAALYKQIPLHGRMYVSQNYVCFESKIFSIKTTEVIPFKDVTHIRKKSNKMKFSVGIHIDIGATSYHFASFVARDKTFVLLHDLWRQIVPAHSDSSDPDEDDVDDDDEEVEEIVAPKGGRLNRVFTDASLPISKQARSLPPSPRSSLRLNADILSDNSSSSLASLALDSSLTNPLREQLKSEASNGSLSSSPVEASILESMGVAGNEISACSAPITSPSITPPATEGAPTPSASDVVPASEAVAGVPPTPTETLFDDEHLSPGEADDTEDGFLEAEVFQNLCSETFDVSTLNFFRAFFSDRSNFIRKYHEKRGDKEISIPKWSNSPQFGMIRNIQYYAPVKVPLGPDKTRVQETQRYIMQKSKLQLETITVMFDIPYGDCFRLESKIIVTSPSPTTNSCTVQVSLCVHFVKKTWFKGKIESQSLKEMRESFKQWVEMAREELSAPDVIERISFTNLLQPKSTSPTPVSTTPPPIVSSSQPSSTAATPTKPSPPTHSTAASSDAATNETSPVAHRAAEATKDVRTHATHTPHRVVKKLPSPPTDSSLSVYGVNIGSVTKAFDTQAILMILVIFLSFFCIYLYAKVSYLEGKFSVVENLMHRQLFDDHGHAPHHQ